MPYEISWYIPDRILLMQYFGDLTVEELRQSSHEAAEILDARPPDLPTKCYVVADNTNLEKMPPSLAAFKNALKRPHPSVGWICLIGNNSVENMIASTLSQMMGINFKVFPSRQDVLHFLVERDPALADLIPADDLQDKS